MGRHKTAAEQLRQMGKLGETPALAYYNHPDTPARTEVRTVLADLMTTNEAYVKRCLTDLQWTSRPSADRYLEDHRANWQRTALNSLKALRPGGEPDVNAGVRMEVEKLIASPALSTNAFKALEVWGTKDSVPLLLEASKDGAKMERAVKVILAVAPDDPRGYNRLLDLLKDGGHRATARKMFGEMGDKGEAVLSQVALNPSPDKAFRKTVYETIGEVGTARSIPVLQKAAAFEQTSKAGDRRHVPVIAAAVAAIQARGGMKK
jgi:HEAT repeat protein